MSEPGGIGRTLQTAVLTGSAGAGAVLTYTVIAIMREEPKAVIAMLGQWGPWFVLMLVGIVMVDRWVRDNATTQRKMADAMQQQADAMARIAAKDEQRDQDRQLALDHLAYTAQAILAKVQSIDNRCVSICRVPDHLSEQPAAGERL